MRTPFFLAATSFTVGLIATTAFQSHAAPRPLWILGSGHVHALASHAAQAFEAVRPDVRVEVGSGGSRVGIEACVDGSAAIGMIARDLTDEERAAHPDLVVHDLGAEPILLFAHPSCGVEKLSLEELRGIYAGEVRNWSEVGGSDAAIEALMLQVEDGVDPVFAQLLGLEASSAGQQRAVLRRSEVAADLHPGHGVRTLSVSVPVAAFLATRPNTIAYGAASGGSRDDHVIGCGSRAWRAVP